MKNTFCQIFRLEFKLILCLNYILDFLYNQGIEYLFCIIQYWDRQNVTVWCI